MATQEAIFLTTEPALAEGELRDVAMLGVDLELDVVLVVHVLLEALGLGSKEPKDFLFGFYHGFALAVWVKIFFVGINVLLRIGIAVEEIYQLWHQLEFEISISGKWFKLMHFVVNDEFKLIFQIFIDWDF